MLRPTILNKIAVLKNVPLTPESMSILILPVVSNVQLDSSTTQLLEVVNVRPDSTRSLRQEPTILSAMLVSLLFANLATLQLLPSATVAFKVLLL